MSRRPLPSAFTLLEVILALAILGVAMGVLVEVSRLTLRNARTAVLETEATLIAESVLAELESGASPLDNLQGEWMDDSPQAGPAEWEYQVLIEQTQLTELLQARITVSQILDTDLNQAPFSLTLIRLFPDPTYMQQIATTSEVAE